MTSPESASVGTEVRVPRRATEMRDRPGETRVLAEWRDLDAYVLLGDPGAGKSEALRLESEASNGLFINARDFNTLGIEPEDSDKTLFIDGLDEVRAGTPDGRAPLDAIRAKLKQLGRPRFRLSCREYDWRTQTDLAALKQVAPAGEVRELHLEPLSADEQRQIVLARSKEIPDADGFLRHARQQGLDALFGNPLLLDLTIRAVTAQGGWPRSRERIYALACRELVTERSAARLDLKPLQPGEIDRLLDDAGMLCAIILLSGRAAVTRAPQASSDLVFAWNHLPADLHLLHDPDAALASKVFATSAGQSIPRHRSIAEYLAARALAKRLQQGLPLERILALMQGADSRIVEPLRGLLGWLAVHDPVNRQRLIRLDPMSTILNGDVTAFGTDKTALLEALRDEAQRNPWFRQSQWVSYPFAPLAVPEMTDALLHVLADHDPGESHQALVDCVVDALKHASLPALTKTLETWVEDQAAWFSNRYGALQAWKLSTGVDSERAKQWLEQLHEGTLQDLDGRLASDLLGELYPMQVGADEVLKYWPKPGGVRINATLPFFWTHGLLKQSRAKDFPILADAWLQMKPQPRDAYHHFEWSRIHSGVLAGALEQSGDCVNIARLYGWLGMGLDEHDLSRLDTGSEGQRISQWLTDRPERMKAVVAFGWETILSEGKSDKPAFWKSAERLHGARRPRDWLQWLLQQAADAPDEDLASYCFTQVASAVVTAPGDFDVPALEELEAWIEAHASRFPQAKHWLESTWSCPLEDWRSDDHRRKRKHEADNLARREKRKVALAPHMDALLRGTAPAQLMEQLAGAYQERFYDISGDTPEARVQDFLVCDHVTALAAIEGLVNVLRRSDLPSADDVLREDAKGKYYHIRSAALLAAQLVHKRNVGVVETWPEELLATLVAFWLTDGTGETPEWYTHAVRTTPAIIAPLLVRFAMPRLRRKGPLFVTGLWSLPRDSDQAMLAKLVVPTLLETFPQRASEAARQILNQSLLGSLHVLNSGDARQIVQKRLASRSMDIAQRICWLVADLPFRAEAAAEIVDLVGRNERRVVALGIALHDQGSLSRALKQVPATTLSQLIEVLAPISRPDRFGAGWVTPAHERGDTVRSLIDMLAANPSPAAAKELLRLMELPQLQPWRMQLHHSSLSQQGVAREAGFRYAPPEAVAATIANCSPANHADLKALVLDHLRDIELHLRGADTFALRLFWTDRNALRGVPKSENDCRDLLLGELRNRLAALTIQTIPERRAADEKRADLRIELHTAGQSLVLPVEIKKEDNPNLWLAWRSQLQALYSVDPLARGHGIYLVLWFGSRPRPSPDGIRPQTAQDLERLLIERIPANDRPQLAVRVMDLSLPATSP